MKWKRRNKTDLNKKKWTGIIEAMTVTVEIRWNCEWILLYTHATADTSIMCLRLWNESNQFHSDSYTHTHIHKHKRVSSTQKRNENTTNKRWIFSTNIFLSILWLKMTMPVWRNSNMCWGRIRMNFMCFAYNSLKSLWICLWLGCRCTRQTFQR